MASSNALTMLKQKKVWIPLTILGFMFCTVAACSYLLAQLFKPPPQGARDFPMNDILVASIDPDKRKHLSRGEVAYFEAERFVAERNYRRAHQYFCDACDEFAAATGSSSPVACIMLMRQAQFESKHHKWDRAEQVLRRALANLPAGDKADDLRLDVNKWLGYVLQGHRKYKEAIVVLEANVAAAEKTDRTKHITGDFNKLAALKALLSCYIAARQYDNADKVAGDMLAIAQKRPDEPKLIADAWLEVGRVKSSADRKEEAIEAFNKAVAADPKSIAAYRARGIAYDELNQYRKAISDFSIIIVLDPKDENAYEWRSWVYQAEDEKEKAIADLSEAIRIGGSDESAYDNRARLYVVTGHYKEAIADYGESLELNGNPWTYMYRANTYAKISKYDEAIADYSKALDSKYFVAHSYHPEDPAEKSNYNTMGAAVYAQRAKCYEALGQKDRAQADRMQSAAIDLANGRVGGPGKKIEAVEAPVTMPAAQADAEPATKATSKAKGRAAADLAK
jgi:tetratricopeptide (TPR) repeat protein